MNSFALNIYDPLYHEQVIISEAAVKELEQLLGPKKDAEAPQAEAKVEAAAAESDAPAKPKRAKKAKAVEADSQEATEK